MRLWHKDLIEYLPKQQLIGQWRECCSIAKEIKLKGTPNHILVNKIMEYDEEDFNAYTDAVIGELRKRGYKIDDFRFFQWRNHNKVSKFENIFITWHNGTYLRICMTNLYEKYICDGFSYEEWVKLCNRFYDLTKENYKIG